MPEDNDESPLGQLRDSLYAPQAPASIPAPRLSAAPPAIDRSWAPPPPPKKPGPSLTLLFFIGAGAFFVVAAVVATLLIMFGGRTVSTDHVEISIQGPATIGSGDTVPLLISVKNGNPVEVMDTTLSLDFPEGTHDATAQGAPLSHYSDSLGAILPGDRADRTVQAVFFGSEGQTVRVPVRLEYRTAGSNTAFVKEESYDVTITTSPLSVSVGTLSQVAAGMPFTVAVAVRSNASVPLANAALLVEYPPGFVAQSATPSPVSGSLFDLGTIAPGEEKVVSIRGVLTAEDRDIRVFRFTTGTRASADATSLAVSYTTVQAPVTIERTFLAPTLSLNRDTSGALVLSPGQQVDGVLSWINTLSVPLQDAALSIKLGGAIDLSSVQAGNGFYRSSDTTIVYSKESIPALAQVPPGETGNGTFGFSVRNADAATSLRNPTVTFMIAIAGKRLNEGSEATAVASSITRTFKVQTDLSLTARTLRTSGPFKNTGPWPPVPDSETTYTIEWSLANSVNSVGGTRVAGSLPSYVRFVGPTSPADGSVVYNAAARTVTWNAGDVPAGTTAKKASFQVAITPSTSQRGTSPALVTGQEASGTDRFTSTKVVSAVPDATLYAADDPAWNPLYGQVQ